MEPGEQQSGVRTRSQARRLEEEQVEEVQTMTMSAEVEERKKKPSLSEFMQFMKELKEDINKSITENIEGINKRMDEHKQINEENYQMLKEEMNKNMDELKEEINRNVRDVVENNMKGLREEIQKVAEKHDRDVGVLNHKIEHVCEEVGEIKNKVESNQMQIINLAERMDTQEKEISSELKDMKEKQNQFDDELKKKVCRERLKLTENQDTVTQQCSINTEMIDREIRNHQENKPRFSCTERMIPAEFVEAITKEYQSLGRTTECKLLVKENLRQKDTQWAKYTKYIENTMNATFHSAIGNIPYTIMYGLHPPRPWDDLNTECRIEAEEWNDMIFKIRNKYQREWQENEKKATTKVKFKEGDHRT